VILAILASKIGRFAAAIMAAMSIVGTALLMARRSGRKAEREEATRAAIENLQSRAKTDDQVASASPDDRRRDLSRWVR
jgi:hypothetical protein